MNSSLGMDRVHAGSKLQAMVGRWLMNPIRTAVTLLASSGAEAREQEGRQDLQSSSEQSQWTLAEEGCGRSARLTLEGDALTDTSVVAVVACGRRMLASRSVRIILDLQGVRQADTRLIASLLLLRREAIGQGTSVVLRASRSVREWAQVCRVEGLLCHMVRARA